MLLEERDTEDNPSRDDLREHVRALRERRYKPCGPRGGKFDEGGMPLDVAIRSRTTLTIAAARTRDSNSGDVEVAREAELARQRDRFNELRRVYDSLHADRANTTFGCPRRMRRR